MRRQASEGNKGPKIIAQYRTKSGRACEIQSSSTVIALHIWQEDGPGIAWHAQAQALSEQGAIPVNGQGSTRADALRNVASAWNLESNRLVAFDWEAATKELQLVRAI